MRKLCFISPKFSNHIGGMETHAYEFAKAFYQDQEYPLHSVLVKAVINDGILAPNKEEQDGIYGKSFIPKDFDGIIKQVLTGDFKRDAEIIINNYDVKDTIFYINSPTWLPCLQLIKQKYPTTKVIVRSGGNDIIAGWVGDETDTLKKLEESRKNLVEMVNKYVDVFIVNSNYSYNRSLSVGVKPERMIKVIGGVDCSAFYPVKCNNQTVNILTAARLVEFKGFEYSIRAIKECVKKGMNNFHYVIVGDGPEKNKLEQIIVSYNLIEQVELLGAKRVEDIPNYFRKANIFLHMPINLKKHERGSSYIHTETMGRCLCEASASGLPIVTTEVGGVPEIVIDGKTGYLVQEKDYISASERLQKLIINCDLRRTIGANGRKRAEEMFDWKIVFKQYKEIFR